MDYFYSEKTGCFYPDGYADPEMPDDLIEVSAAEFEVAMNRKPDERIGVIDGRIVVVAAPIISSITLRAEKLLFLKERSDAITSALRIDYPTDEVLSWGKQEIEARAFIADKSSPAPLLSEIAANRGLPIEILAQKVVEKADAYAAFTGHVFGVRQALEDRLMAIDLNAPDAIDQINAVTWPLEDK